MDEAEGTGAESAHSAQPKEESGLAGAAARTTTRVAQQAFRGGGTAVNKAGEAAGRALAATKALSNAGALKAARLPVKHIAKLADKGSQVADMIEATGDPRSKSLQAAFEEQGVAGAIKGVAKRFRSFAVNIFKSALAGVVVFEGYDKLVDYYCNNSAHPPPIALNIMCGGIAGVGHGLLMTMFDTAGHYALAPPLSVQPCRLLGNGSSHAILFGSYEGLKRLADQAVALQSTHLKLGVHTDIVALEEGEGDDRPVGLAEIGVVAIAGGIAGGMQQIVTHYAELIEERGSITSFLRTTEHVPRPAVRAVAAAFLPSAIGFMAFEFGRELL
jgi:hypothetical protein